MSDPLLSVSGLSVRTGEREIISDLSFDVDEGSVLGLFGDSGCGKTTLIHAICGLTPPGMLTTGEITFKGRAIGDAPPEVRSRLGLAIVLQSLGLFEDRSVYRNVAYGLERRGLPAAAVASAVDETLAFLRLSELADRRPHQLSGGQRQRVALARAIAYQPSLLLLDEPLRGLQDELRLEFLAFVRQLARDGTTIIFVTHDRMELQLVASRVVTLKDGRLTGSETRSALHPFGLLADRFEVIASDGAVEEFRRPRLAAPGADDAIPFEALEWRPLGGGRAAALMRRPDGPVSWVIFDDLPRHASSLPTGPILVSGERKG
jgi:ABC-type sulfate/molybdate transport systems ATPase subunit